MKPVPKKANPKQVQPAEIEPVEGIVTVDPPLIVEEQKEDNWCWAAVASAIHNRKHSKKRLTQCDVASRVFPDEGDACADPRPFDRVASLEVALDRVGMLHNAEDGRAPFDEIQAEIGKNRPLCARIVKDRNGDGIVESAHFVVIVGCGIIDGVPHVRVEDPEGSSFIGPLATFQDNYGKEWTWVSTYFIKE